MTLGGSGLILSDRWLGVEGEFGYSPRFFEQANASNLVAGSHVITLMGNFLVALPRSVTRDGLRPYGTVGLGLIHVDSEDLLNVLPVDSNLFGMSVGGGAIGPLTTRTSLRFDLRYIRNISAGGDDVPSLISENTRISYWRLTAGVAFSGNLF
jgi:opacity protein-like surface antigen